MFYFEIRYIVKYFKFALDVLIIRDKNLLKAHVLHFHEMFGNPFHFSLIKRCIYTKIKNINNWQDF